VRIENAIHVVSLALQDTTAKQLVMLAITEFGIVDPSRSKYIPTILCLSMYRRD
jgi:translation initiation factor 2B subunit (eIF-2B alpha/beta/delta family)